MKYAYIMPNDFVNGEGVSVSVWMQGCPFHCSGCHNPELWSLNGGTEINYQDFINKIQQSLTANGIIRNLSILGGQPLYEEGALQYTGALIKWCKATHPEVKIFLWTGYTIEELSDTQKDIAFRADVIVDGQYKQQQRDISLHLRGSSNQRILIKGEHYAK